MRVAVLATPLGVSFAFVHFASYLVRPPAGPLGAFLIWWLALTAGATAVLFVVDRFVRRLLPLAALLHLSLIFPDETPSRFKLALRSGNVDTLEKRLALVHEARSASTPRESAARLLELVAALSVHDRLTRGHSERVRAYSRLIGKEMGLGAEDLDRLNWAALLHDIGKLEVPESILTKPGKPSDAEWELLRQHPLFGEKLAGPMRAWLGSWWEAIGYHHERWDGKGYPRGLGGDDIPLPGRIVAVADVYDVITSARSYKDAGSSAEGRAEIAACAGTQFDPRVVRAFLNVSLGRMRLIMGPLSWLGRLPALGRVDLAPALAGLASTVGVVAAVIGTGSLAGPARTLPGARAGEPSLALAHTAAASAPRQRSQEHAVKWEEPRWATAPLEAPHAAAPHTAAHASPAAVVAVASQQPVGTTPPVSGPSGSDPAPPGSPHPPGRTKAPRGRSGTPPMPAPEEPASPQPPAAPGAPPAPELPTALEPPMKAPESPPSAPETPGAPETPSTPPETPESPSTPPETPSTPESPSTPPEAPESPSTPPETPESPSTPPETPESPSTPPETPESPSTPPETPESPSTPPETPTATKLAFTTEPGSAQAGTPVSVAVSVQDASSETVTSDDATTVTLSLQSSPAGASLTCTNPGGAGPVTVESGVADFTCTFEKSGSYQLTATDSTEAGGGHPYASASSSAFTINPGPAAALSFSTEPSGTSAGHTISPAVQVSVLDSYGNLVSDDSSTAVTLAIGANPGLGTLSGTTSETVSDGTATFSDLSISTAGDGYTLTASSSPALANATSTPFNVALATLVTAAAVAGNSSTPCTAGSSCTTASISPAAGTTLLILVQRGGSTTASDAITSISGPFTGASAVSSLEYPTASSGDYLFAWTATASGASGSVTVNFASGSNANPTVVDVIALGANNTSAPVAQQVSASAQSGTATATLPAPNPFNGEVVMVSYLANASLSLPLGFVALDTLQTGSNGGECYGLYFSSAAQASTSIGASSEGKGWGAIAIEIDDA